jgi:hypothetical protein
MKYDAYSSKKVEGALEKNLTTTLPSLQYNNRQHTTFTSLTKFIHWRKQKRNNVQKKKSISQTQAPQCTSTTTEK